MKRSLLTQMGNEWRDNLWLVLGITIVGLAVWFFSLQMYETLYTFFAPLGFDRTDVYAMRIGRLSKSSPDYVESEEGQNINNDDIRSLLEMIRNSEHVEAAGLAYNGVPYELSAHGEAIFMRGEGIVDTIGYYGNRRVISPDVVRVLKLRSINGRSLEYLEERLRAGEVLVGTLPYGMTWPMDEPQSLVGHTAQVYSDSLHRFRVADVVETVRRSGFDYSTGGTIIHPLDESVDATTAWHIILRVKPGHGKLFREQFENTPAMQSLRNMYLYNLNSLEDMRMGVERESNIELRISISVICFIVIIVGLGLMGTFWFRVQQRVSEIAIRRVCGASKRDIFRRIVSEGLILLLIAIPFITAIGLIYYRVYMLGEAPEGFEGRPVSHLLLLEAATCVVVAIGIVLSMIVPARQAMRIEPAVAVKEE